MAHSIKLNYDRNTYVLDLDRVSAFCHAPNDRLSFSIFDGSITIVIIQQSDPKTYQAFLDYIEEEINDFIK